MNEICSVRSHDGEVQQIESQYFYLVLVEVRFFKTKLAIPKSAYSGIVIVTITTTSACQNQFALMYTLQLNYKEFNLSFYFENSNKT
jgi:hypothetical protein